ncbi:MAG: RES domain-containing protein [Acidobacteriaceae bacterium]
MYRLGRLPHPWEPPDWSKAHSDRTFGNRFDDPEGYYRVLYASSQRLSCFVETLARLRPDLTLLAELKEIDGTDDYFPIGVALHDWLKARIVGKASATGRYADIYSSGWVAYLRRELAGEALLLGLKDIDAAILQQGAPRSLTQMVSLKAYLRRLQGIYYRSRYGHDLENWAIFEPFAISDVVVAPALQPDDPDFLAALQLHHLSF